MRLSRSCGLEANDKLHHIWLRRLAKQLPSIVKGQANNNRLP